MSKAAVGHSRAAGDRQFLFLNGRPVDLPQARPALLSSGPHPRHLTCWLYRQLLHCLMQVMYTF